MRCRPEPLMSCRYNSGRVPLNSTCATVPRGCTGPVESFSQAEMNRPATSTARASLEYIVVLIILNPIYEVTSHRATRPLQPHEAVGSSVPYSHFSAETLRRTGFTRRHEDTKNG